MEGQGVSREEARVQSRSRCSAERAWGMARLCLAAACSLILGCGVAPGVEDETEPLGETHEALATDGSTMPDGTFTTTTTYGLTATTALTADRFVTVGKMGTGAFHRIGVILWQLEYDGTVTHIDSFTSDDDVSSKISVARVDDSRFVVAARSSAGNLFVAAFVVAEDDVITQTSEVASGAISDVDVTSMNMSPGALAAAGPAGPVSEGHVLVAYRANNTALTVAAYSMDAAGNLTRRGALAAGAVPSVAVTTVPGSQPPSAWYSRSTDTTERSGAACGDGSDNDADGYVDCNDWDCCGNAACDGVGSCVQGTVVTASPNNFGNLKLVAWRVSAQGNLTRLGEAAGVADVGSFDMAPQSFRRIATVGTTSGNPVISTWNVDAAGNLALHSSYTPAVAATGARIVNGGGVRLFVELTTANGEGRLQLVEGIDQLRGLERILLPGRHWGNAGGITSLAQDRAIFAWPNADNKLEVRAYRDYHMPLLKGSYVQSAPTTTTPVDNASTFNFLPPASGSAPFSPSGDSSIAVGEKFVVACGNGVSAIYDRAGNNLTGGSSSSAIFHSTLFGSFLKPTTSGGAVNEHSINRHLVHQHLCDGSRLPSSTTGARNACQDSYFDTDCTYDDTTKRFVITSMLRYFGGAHWAKDKMQRYMAIAVSKTDDPRQGFNTFITTENKYHDNPMTAATSGMLVVSHQSDAPEDLTPSAWVFDTEDMTNGHSDPLVTKLSPAQTGSSSLKVATSRGSQRMGVLYRWSSGIRSYFFKRPAGRGPVSVTADRASVSPTTKAGADSNGFLWLDQTSSSPLNTWSGKLYVVDRYIPDAGGRQVRVTGIDVSGTDDPASRDITSLTADTRVSVDAAGCKVVTDRSCTIPSMVALADRVVAVYGEFDAAMELCPANVACSTGLCKAGACVTNPVYPRMAYTRFSRDLTSPVSGTLSSGLDAHMGQTFSTWNLDALEHSATAVDPVSAKSIWYIGTNTSARNSWRMVAGRRTW